MRLPWLLVGVCTLAFAPALTLAHEGPPVAIEDVQVTIRVQQDGGLDVTERVQVSSDASSSVYWPVGGKRAADVSSVEVVASTPADVAASVEVDGAQVGWLIPAGASSVTLRYRVADVARSTDGRTQLRWDAVPADRDEVIGIAKVIVQLPQMYDPAALTTDLVTSLANDNTQHRMLDGRTLYYEGRQVAGGTTLSMIASWPSVRRPLMRLSDTQLGLIQPLAIALLCLMVLWVFQRRVRSTKQEV